MLRRTSLALSGGVHHNSHGLPLLQIYPKGEPKRTSPMRVPPKHPGLARTPGGFYMTRYVLGWPLHPPFEYHFYRTPCLLFVVAVLYDLIYGMPVLFHKEKVPGAPSHFWFNNNGGIPHHFWCYQDGWYIPNPSGVQRFRE